jgi:hypothetical protein
MNRLAPMAFVVLLTQPPIVPASQLRVVSITSEPTTDTKGLNQVAADVKSADGQRVARVQPIGRGAESTRARLVITGPGQRRVTLGEVVNHFGTAWSPGGRTIAYCSGAILTVADSDGKTSQALHRGPGGAYPGACFDIAWSADGGTISFTQVENAEQLDISTPKRITLTLGARAGPIR